MGQSKPLKAWKMLISRVLRTGLAAGAALWLAGCQSLATAPAARGAATTPAAAARTPVDAPDVWGGELRCGTQGCLLVAVEHEKSTVVLYRIKDRQAQLLDRRRVAYHPDSAIWLADDLLVAAVEDSLGLDLFRVQAGQLKRIHQVEIGFSPRDVVLVEEREGRYRMLATPYSGKEVAWVDFDPAQPQASSVQRVRWCEAPWHPVRLQRAPGQSRGGIAAACLDDKQVAFAPEDNLLAPARPLLKIPVPGYVVPRQARPSPSGRWLYVALETGNRNLRMDMDSGELQWITAPLIGAVGVLPLTDDLVIWAADSRLYLQRLGPDGEVLETRWLPVDGFATGLQLQDADGDGIPDLVVYNAAVLPGKMGMEIIYGPLWDQAQNNMPPPQTLKK